MTLHVVFRDSPIDCASSEYILKQPEWQRSRLQQFVNELINDRRIQHPDARRVDGDVWSLWLRREGEEAINHECYLARVDAPILSDFAKQLLEPSPSTKTIERASAKRLMIHSLDPHAVSIGKADEYLDPDYFASLMDPIRRNLFSNTVEAIKKGQASTDYSINKNGSYTIHIVRSDTDFKIEIRCMASWV